MPLPTHRVLTRGGHTLCYLPSQPRAACETLRLYPAQRWTARLARFGLRWALRVQVPWFGSREAPPPIPWSALKWFDEAPTGFRPAMEQVGALAGNPAAVGRRFIYLLFDAVFNPIAVLKLGFNEAARKKIVTERKFLTSFGGRHPGIPKLIGELSCEEAEGLMLPYFRGATRSTSLLQEDVADILSSWIHSDTPQLAETFPALALQLRNIDRHPLKGAMFCPVIAHGDLAPWNMVRTAGHGWQVIDWENGTDQGVPGWDWFHLIIQPASLVDRVGAEQIWSRLQSLWQSDVFRAYAARAGIKGWEHALLSTYLRDSLNRLQENREGADAERLRATAQALLEYCEDPSSS